MKRRRVRPLAALAGACMVLWMLLAPGLASLLVSGELGGVVRYLVQGAAEGYGLHNLGHVIMAAAICWKYVWLDPAAAVLTTAVLGRRSCRRLGTAPGRKAAGREYNERGDQLMETTQVQKLARVLNVLVTLALCVNVLVLVILPAILYYDPNGLLEGTGALVDEYLHLEEDDIVMAGVAWVFFYSWLGAFMEPATYHLGVCLFLLSVRPCARRTSCGRPGGCWPPFWPGIPFRWPMPRL